MPSDPIANPGTEGSRALFERFLHEAHNRPIEEVLSASINMIANCLRQSYGLRSEVESRIDELFGRAKEMLLEHYDPATGRRRSVVPFDQVVRPHLVMQDDQFTNLGDKRRH